MCPQGPAEDHGEEKRCPRKCSDAIHAASSIRCEAVLNTSKCASDGFIQYTKLVYCQTPGALHGLGIFALFVILFIFFLGLSVTADGFFVPSLSVITNQLKISENVAGVTFLAFGNGAPDIFSAIAAVNGGTTQKPGLMFGALIGAGIFVTTVVVGAVCVTAPFEVMQRPFLRDVIFYLWTAFFSFYVLYDGRITLGEAIGFIIIYLAYVIVVIGGRYVRAFIWKKRGVDVEATFQTVPVDHKPSIHSAGNTSKSSVASTGRNPDASHNSEGGEEPAEPPPPAKILRTRDSWIEEAQWNYRPRHNPLNPRRSGLAQLDHVIEEDEVEEAGIADEGHDGVIFALDDSPIDNTVQSDAFERTDQAGSNPASVFDLPHPSTDELIVNGVNGAASERLPKQEEAVASGEKPSRKETPMIHHLSQKSRRKYYGYLFWYGIRPSTWSTFMEAKIYKKLYMTLEYPVLLILNLTIPLVDLDAEYENWNKPLLIVQALICPQIALVCTQSYDYWIGGKLPLAVLMLIIGIAIALALALTSTMMQPARYHRFVAFAGFVMAIIWIYRLAEEIVGILTTMGMSFGISETILGLTLLAWANSLGDLVADISVAREGYARMAVSACFGSPLFNMCLAVGISFSILTVQSGQAVELKFSGVEEVLVLFIGVSLIFSLIAVPLLRFRANRIYGIALFAIYIVFIIVAILTELKKIPAMGLHST